MARRPFDIGVIVFRFRSGALLASLLLLLAACGSDDGATTPDTAAAPDGEREVVVLTHDSFDVSTDVIALFEETHGITVRLVPLGDAGTALNQAILTADAPQGDILFGVDNTFLTRALDADLFDPYLPGNFELINANVLEELQAWSSAAAFSVDNPPPVVPITYGDVCVNYDKAWFAARDLAVPTGFADFVDPAYRGLLTIMNPATSSPGLAFMLASITAFDGDEYLSYWQQLADNDVLITNGWSQAYYDEFSASGGDRPLVVSYASSPPAEVLFADPPVDEAPTGVLLDTCFRQVEFAGILNGAANRAEAELFLEFMLDIPFQEDIPLTMFVFPVNTQAVLPDVFVEHAEVPETVTSFGLLTDTQRDVFLAEWSAIMLG